MRPLHTLSRLVRAEAGKVLRPSPSSSLRFLGPLWMARQECWDPGWAGAPNLSLSLSLEADAARVCHQELQCTVKTSSTWQRRFNGAAACDCHRFVHAEGTPHAARPCQQPSEAQAPKLPNIPRQARLGSRLKLDLKGRCTAVSLLRYHKLFITLLYSRESLAMQSNPFSVHRCRPVYT